MIYTTNIKYFACYRKRKDNYHNNYHNNNISSSVVWKICCWCWLFSIYLNPSGAADNTTTTTISGGSSNTYYYYTLENLPRCALSTLELAQLDETQNINPCILFDSYDDYNDDDNKGDVDDDIPSIILLQVTPTHCGNHRDGAKTSVQFLNYQKGVPLGFVENITTTTSTTPVTHVRFRLLSIIGGNPFAMSSADSYKVQHRQVLNDILNETKAPYVIGTCSAWASVEPAIAQQYQSILMGQVGPEVFYQQQQEFNGDNNFVFGMHIDSAEYPLPSVQALVTRTSRFGNGFGLETPYFEYSFENRKEIMPIKIFASLQSDFYFHTCQSAYRQAAELGFQDIQQILYDPNSQEEQQATLLDIADEICPPPPHSQQQQQQQQQQTSPPSTTDNTTVHPAIYICALREHEILIQRWLETGCRPTSLWMTAATDEVWTANNQLQVPFIQGGAQWHESMTYADEYFPGGGTDLLLFNEIQFGYYGDYNQIVSYSIPSVIAQQLQAAYSLEETSQIDPITDLQSSEGREKLRRSMLVVQADTLFGHVLFDPRTQRNVGRTSAGTQWQPAANASNILKLTEEDYENAIDLETAIDLLDLLKPPTFVYDHDVQFVNRLVSPQLQAASMIVLSTDPICPPGESADPIAWGDRGSVLLTPCRECPVDTYSSTPSEISNTTNCTACPDGTSTGGETGAAFCVAIEDNLIPDSILRFGFFAVSLSWAMSLFFMGWMCFNRKHTVVNIGQPGFLALICVGAIISSATIISLSFQAGTGEDTDAASTGCSIAPFLYTIGWILMYSSLCAKTYRLYRVMKNSRENQDGSERRKIVTFWSVLMIVFVALAVDMSIVISLTVVNPLVYERTVVDEDYQIDDGGGGGRLLVIESIGRCQLTYDHPSFWAFLIPIVAFHLALVAAVFSLLIKVRKFSSRYQEFKYIALSMVLMLQCILIGIPVLFAVQGVPKLVHLIVIFAIAGHDVSILCFIFIPKIYYKNKKTEEDHGEAHILAAFQTMGRTQWDDSIDLINRLVQPGSKTRKAMTDDQVMQLDEVKALLIQGLQQGAATKKDKLGFLPSNLASKVSLRPSSASSRQPSTLRTDNSEIQYILKEFAGLNATVDASIRDGCAQSFEVDFAMDYILPEFEKLEKENQKAVFEMLSWSNLKRWDFNIFEMRQLTGGNPLLFIGWAILGSPYAQYAMAVVIGENEFSFEDFPGYSFSDSSLRIPLKKLCDYIRVIQQDYISSNPYHNDTHAADVVQTLHVLIQMMVEAGGEYEITEEQLFSALLAAVVHDVNHPGKNNSFQVNAKTGLALLYNNASVLENRHAAHAFMKMLGKEKLTGDEGLDNQDRNDDINPLCNLTNNKFSLIRGMIIECVMHTDMSTHFQSVTATKTLVLNEGADTLSSEGVWKSLQFMLHLADISNPAKGDPMFRLWTDRCLNEFFAQGDMERELGLPISPNCDRIKTRRAESQVGFIRYVIMPAYEVLGMIIPQVETCILPTIRSNEAYWEKDAVREKKLETAREYSANRRMTVEFEPTEHSDLRESKIEASTTQETKDTSNTVDAKGEVAHSNHQSRNRTSDGLPPCNGGDPLSTRSLTHGRNGRTPSQGLESIIIPEKQETIKEVEEQTEDGDFADSVDFEDDGEVEHA